MGAGKDVEPDHDAAAGTPVVQAGDGLGRTIIRDASDGRAEARAAELRVLVHPVDISASEPRPKP